MSGKRTPCGSVLVVVDDKSVRTLVVTPLERAGFQTREAAFATEAVDALDGPPPALAVLDVHVPGGPSGYELRRALDERFGPKVPVLFIAGERTQSLDGVDGVDGSDYLTTPFAPDELVARVRALVRTVLSVDLTPREREILVLFAEGLTQERIARALVISPKTVATHIDRVLGKLGVHSRAEAVAVAYRSGLVAATIDDKSVRTLVVTLLERAGFETHEAASAIEAVEALDDPPPALAVLDVHLPGGPSGYELRRALHERFGPDVSVLFIAGERTESLDRADGSPIDGGDYLTTPYAPDELVARVRALVHRSRRAVLSVGLTPREREILVLLAEGLTQERIARALVISPRTVATHIDRVLGKLGVHSRAEAVAVAYRSGLVAADS